MLNKTSNARFENHTTTETKTIPHLTRDTHNINRYDLAKRKIIDSISPTKTGQVRSTFTRLINKGRATPQQAYCLLQIPILKYSHTPDRDLSIIRSLRHLSRRGQ